MGLKEICYEGIDGINMAHNKDRPVFGPCEHSNEPLDSAKDGELPD
jgi:hypothetical protein